MGFQGKFFYFNGLFGWDLTVIHGEFDGDFMVIWEIHEVDEHLQSLNEGFSIPMFDGRSWWRKCETSSLNIHSNILKLYLRILFELINAAKLRSKSFTYIFNHKI